MSRAMAGPDFGLDLLPARKPVCSRADRPAPAGSLRRLSSNRSPVVAALALNRVFGPPTMHPVPAGTISRPRALFSFVANGDHDDETRSADPPGQPEPQGPRQRAQRSPRYHQGPSRRREEQHPRTGRARQSDAEHQQPPVGVRGALFGFECQTALAETRRMGGAKRYPSIVMDAALDGFRCALPILRDCLTVIASEAKQSMGHKERMDCFAALLLAMTASARAVVLQRHAPVAPGLTVSRAWSDHYAAGTNRTALLQSSSSDCARRRSTASVISWSTKIARAVMRCLCSGLSVL